ncbi:MAG: hypothetical protein H6719_11320 [Sandaracinaceae bacterium]|nr:hypothetical protein [Sandaracinaceae bacterium]
MSEKKGGATESDEHLALLREIRDLQKESVQQQKAHMWILLPIFALLAILLILGLAGFF